jgi:hypothetical protein
MSTRNFTVFARRHEMNVWLDGACAQLGAALVQQDRERSLRRVLRAADLDADAGVVRAYLTIDAAMIAGVREKIVPGRLGLVTFDLPTEEGKTLLLSTLASRSDWRGDDGLRHDNPACHRLFAALRKSLTPHLRAGCWTRSILTGAIAKNPEVHVSEGARAWVEGGGKLRQRGVGNVEFLLEVPGGSSQ